MFKKVLIWKYFTSNYRKFWEEEQKKKSENEGLEEIFEDAEFELKQQNRRKIEVLKKGLNGTEVEQTDAVEEENKDGLIQADSLNFQVSLC